MSEQAQYYVAVHHRKRTVTAEDGTTREELVPFASSRINRERQRGKRFRAEHGGLSGRQFRKARKAGNRLAREQGKAA